MDIFKQKSWTFLKWQIQSWDDHQTGKFQNEECSKYEPILMFLLVKKERDVTNFKCKCRQRISWWQRQMTWVRDGPWQIIDSTRDVLFEFHLKFRNTTSIGIPAYYKVDRFLYGLTAQPKGTTARWYTNKTSLISFFLATRPIF